MPELVIKHNRKKSLLQHHPWVFSGSIEQEQDGILPGQTVELVTRDGTFLARAAYSPHSQIRARVWTFTEDENVDIDFFRRKIKASISIREGLPIETGLAHGKIPENVSIVENNLSYKLNLMEGQKTGFYLDQCKNRKRVMELAGDCEVLDCFSYTGGFSMNALSGGAKSIVTIEASGESLSTAKDNFLINDLPLEKVDFIGGDVFQWLRKFRDSRRSFDLIILDPPKFAQSASQAESASRGYKDINLLAFKLLRPGGILVTFSCSGGLSAEF